MIENPPNFVPLLEQLRTRLGQGRNRALADKLLPRQQLEDRNDNVQRLLTILDRDGSTGLLSSAMDGGVTVELFDGRNTPYWALFKVSRVADGVAASDANDGRDMEYITSAVAQQAGSHDKGSATGAEGILAGSGQPLSGSGQFRGAGGAAGLTYASGSSRRNGTVSRRQLGMKTVADSSAKSTKVHMPLRASLELYKGNTRLELVQMSSLTLTHRILRKDLEALSRVQLPADDLRLATQGRREGDGVPLGSWREAGVRLPMEAQVNGFQGVQQVRWLVDSAVKQAGGKDRFFTQGQSAAYALNEAVSTEWLIAALPLLTTAGADLPPVHATGDFGQDMQASVHARLRNGRVLGLGDKMTFETIGQSHLDAARPTQQDGQSSADRGRSARPLFGAGVLNADEFRLNQLMGNTGGSGGMTDAAANAAGSMPVHKPKMKSVLVQFTLDVRVVATVSSRVKVPGRSRTTATAVKETTPAQPVVIRMPEPVVRRMLAAQGDRLKDDGNHLGLATPPPAT
ncbi:hypothetical protein OG741_34665 [Streptomyces sp. NBC_01410]|uniref:hypothetical protein n=1 Tax=Streptomyces sp. NBC_01410 TaxID=2903856 RepID=UPI003250FB03